MIRRCCICGWIVSGTKDRREISGTSYSYYCECCGKGIYEQDTYPADLVKRNNKVGGR